MGAKIFRTQFHRFFQNGFGLDRLVQLVVGPAQRDHGGDEVRIGFQSVFEDGRRLFPHAGFPVFFGQGNKRFRSGLFCQGQGQPIDLGGIPCSIGI